MTWEVRTGDCVDLMARMKPGSVDAVVCDPPYGLEFMGKEWDRLGGEVVTVDAQHLGQDDWYGRGNAPYGGGGQGVRYGASARTMQEWHHRWASEALRVLKPGGHLLAFGGTRTSHRLVCAIEDAGFEIRDTICWLYGSGFPKSHNLNGDRQGWGTALKPAHEPIVVARKPLAGTVAANVLEHGTGALNVDGCRVEGKGAEAGRLRHGGGIVGNGTSYELPDSHCEMPSGRWPANLLLDETAAAMLDEQSGERSSGARREGDYGGIGSGPLYGEGGVARLGAIEANSGGASRFFYVAKASRAERNAGLDGFPADTPVFGDEGGTYQGLSNSTKPQRNHHPTVKPVSLMRWLCRLATPPGGLVLDPFTGSGTTGIAAVLEGFNFAGCEQDDAYADIARARIGWWEQHGHDALRIVAEQEAAENEREAVRESGQMELL